MKRHGCLFDEMTCWHNLQRAAHRARRRKRMRPNVANFEFDREYELLGLRRALLDETYVPGQYRSFTIFEPKRRIISAAPYRDRVVHHAVCNVLEPLWERAFIADSYACRRGKGTHAAVRHASEFARRFRYVLKADVQQFFPTVDHLVLLELLARKIKDRQVLGLLERLIRHPFPGRQPPPCFAGDDLFTRLERSCGLPIGNQTSQFFANVMLDPIDQFVKRDLRCHGYVRYSDDFLVFGNDKQLLHEQRQVIRERLAALRLKLHQKKSVIFPVEDGIPFLGYRIFPTHRLLGKRSVVRFRRRLRALQRAYAAGRVTAAEIRTRIASWWGHAQHANAWQLARRMLREHAFQRVRNGDGQPNS